MEHSNHDPHTPEQLALLTPEELPLQFRLDQRTRQRGLAHIAAIKAELARKGAYAAPETTRKVTPAAVPTHVRRAA